MELQDHGIREQAVVNQGLLRLHEETGIPLVCTNHCPSGLTGPVEVDGSVHNAVVRDRHGGLAQFFYPFSV